MARKISVIGISGTPENSQIKKVVAQLLVRRMLAVWIIRNVSIQRVSVREANPLAAERIQVEWKPYIPETMPPREVGGCKFQEPTDPNWTAILAHSRYRFRRISQAEQHAA